jgi:deoxyribonuclease V
MVNAPAPVGILDVAYDGERACAACVVAAAWADATPMEEVVVDVMDVKPYRPGAFFERELPCLLAALRATRVALGAVVVDGYVELDAGGTPGLGAHLHQALGERVAVIGVAKSAFRGSAFAAQVHRGARARRPLFVTARGIPTAVAATLVASMHGEHRLPTLITRADRLARMGIDK